MTEESNRTFVCPWWLIRTFDNPLRRVFQKPERILSAWVSPGNHCLDVGCGIGYFTIPLARLVGPTGSVTAVDLQREMLEGVRRRARAASLEERVQLFEATGGNLDVGRRFDFILAFWMVHEVPDQERFLADLRALLEPRGRLLIAEPRVHVRRRDFEATLRVAQKVGFEEVGAPRIAFSRARVFGLPPS